MKKFMMVVALFAMSIVVTPVAGLAYDPEVSNTVTGKPKEISARSAQLLQRLEEIKAMDKELLSREEKKALRQEVKKIRKEMRAAKDGIYLSFGAIIIILLLLILIL
jgi:hypothetical protein